MNRGSTNVVPFEGVVAKLIMARRRPAEQSAKAPKMRGLETPDLEAEFFRIMVLFGTVIGTQAKIVASVR